MSLVITSEPSSSLSVRRRSRRVARAAAVSAGLAVWLSRLRPSADVPEGWSDPDAVDTLHALLYSPASRCCCSC